MIQRRAWRLAVATTAAVVGTALVALSWGPLRNLFSDYQDSHRLVYLLIGGLFLIPGVALVVAAVRIFRARDVDLPPRPPVG